MPYNWVSPTSDNAQQAGWQDGANARDGNTATTASYLSQATGYGEFLELEYAGGLLCDRVRFYANQQMNATIDVDVYSPNEGWIHVYAGPFTRDVFTTRLLPSVKFITKARVRFWEQQGAFCYLKELQFNKLKNCPLVGSSLAGGRKGLI